MKIVHYEVVEDTPELLCIRDTCEPGSTTVTNAAEEVVATLVLRLDKRRLEYYDSEGQRDQILVVDGQFAGFAPILKHKE